MEKFPKLNTRDGKTLASTFGLIGLCFGKSVQLFPFFAFIAEWFAAFVASSLLVFTILSLILSDRWYFIYSLITTSGMVAGFYIFF